jgi:N-acetylmuramoyl-L-alanine amidase
MPISAPTIITRSSWGANGFQGTPAPQPHYRFLTLHHAAGFSASDVDEGKAQVKRIQRLHQEGNGWADIGYHFLIDAAGNIYQGRPYMQDISLLQRPTLVIGAHVAGGNTGNIGVCLLGCFHPETNASTCDDVLTESVETSLVQLCAFLCANYAIAPTHVKGHRDFNSTACPGSNLYPRLPEIRLLVQQVLSAEATGAAHRRGTADVTQPTPAATSDERWIAALRRAPTTGASAVTAAQDGLQPGVAASHQMAQTDLPRVLTLKAAFVLSGTAFDVPPALLAAIASRESRCGHVLAPDGTGDSGNGFGIMQVDKRFHRVLGGPRSQEHVNQAAAILADFRKKVQSKHPSWADEHVLKGALVAYNSGLRNVQTIARMDSGTTGNDYGSDVVARGQFYLQHV